MILYRSVLTLKRPNLIVIRVMVNHRSAYISMAFDLRADGSAQVCAPLEHSLTDFCNTTPLRLGVFLTMEGAGFQYERPLTPCRDMGSILLKTCHPLRPQHALLK